MSGNLISEIVLWTPPADLPADWKAMAHAELPSLGAVWRDWRYALRTHPGGAGIIRRIGGRILREAAAETGYIENLYTLTREVTAEIVRFGINAALIPNSPKNKRTPEETAALIQDQHDAMVGVYDFIKSGRNLSTYYIKEIHAQMVRRQESMFSGKSEPDPQTELAPGEYKRHPNFIRKRSGEIVHFCPPEQAPMEMERLVAMHLAHGDKGIPPEVEAAWLHERFVSIHPFKDGNGRVSRCLASLVLMQAGLFPLVVRQSERDDYFDLLELSRAGNLAPLADFVGERQCETIATVLGAEAAPHFSDAISQMWETAHETENTLACALNKHLNRAFGCDVVINEAKDEQFRHRVVAAITNANPSVSFCPDNHFRAFSIHSGDGNAEKTHIIAFVGYGASPRGLISGHWLHAPNKSDGLGALADRRRFLINYREHPDAAERRFTRWMGACLGRTLAAEAQHRNERDDTGPADGR